MADFVSHDSLPRASPVRWRNRAPRPRWSASSGAAVEEGGGGDFSDDCGDAVPGVAGRLDPVEPSLIRDGRRLERAEKAKRGTKLRESEQVPSVKTLFSEDVIGDD